MIRYLKSGSLFFLAMCLLDQLVVQVYPISYTYQRFSIVPHFALIFFLIYATRLSNRNRLIIGALAGTIMDLFFSYSFFVYLPIFVLFGFLVTLLGEVRNNREVMIFICVAFSFLVDFVPYLMIFFADSTNVVPFHEWILYMEALTVLVSWLGTIVIQSIWTRITKKLDEKLAKKKAEKRKAKRQKQRTAAGA